jgi:hypothetical protein
MTSPIRLHPANPKFFEFRAKPLILVTATEHYGAVMNRPFCCEPYLDDLVDKRMTLTRLFLLFRELQSPRNPSSTCKPDSSDYITPFPRTGPGRATDGELKYDLDRWNPEYFERLHRFMSLASQHGIIVEVTLFSNMYHDTVWALNPFFHENNINNTPVMPWTDYITLRQPQLTGRQLAYARKIVEELNGYDNFLFEICNEPGGKADLPGSPSPAEVNEWQLTIAHLIRSTEAHLPNQHLISGQEAFTYTPFTQTSTSSFRDLPLDVVNIHPLPGTTYDRVTYNMGDFMSKQLKLRALREYCLATYHEPKPVNMDEDNIASQYMDPEGWTIHRKRAWVTLMSGCHYDVIDFSINKYVEAGSPASQRHIRSWMRHLSEFMHSLDLVHARPLPGWLRAQPPHTIESVFAVEGQDYCIYLADEREIDEPGYGEPISGSITVGLPDGAYEVACFLPCTGAYSVWLPVECSAETTLKLPKFQDDLLVRIKLVQH